MFDWFRRTFVPLRRTDPRFGPIRFQRTSGKHGSSYWEGSGTFAGEDVEFFVDAGEDGPGAEQRALVADLERRWSTLQPRLASLLGQHEREARESRVTTRLEDWTLASVSIPAAHDGAGTLELGYLFRDGGDQLTLELDGRGEAPRAVRFGS